MNTDVPMPAAKAPSSLLILLGELEECLCHSSEQVSRLIQAIEGPKEEKEPGIASVSSSGALGQLSRLKALAITTDRTLERLLPLIGILKN